MTNPPPTESALHARIVQHVAALSPQQRVIADYVLEHVQEVPFLSVPELAKRTETSEATVVRFCQRIGYTGYSDLKMALVDNLREDMASAGSSDPRAQATDNVLTAVARLEQDNIERTLDSISEAAFRETAIRLFRADHTFTFGMGISAYLAEFATYLFTEHGLRSTCLATRYTSPLEQLVVLRPTDLVMVFSFPPYSRPTLDVLQEAHERGIPTIAITDRATAPAVAVADHSLVVSSHGMMLTNATSSVNVVLNALVVEIASRHRGETVKAIAGINRILRDQTDAFDDH